MDWIEHFHFIRPWFLLCLLPAVYLWLKLRRSSTVANKWRDVVDADLLEHLLQGEGTANDGSKWHWWVFTGWFVCVVALAGPSWEQRDTPTFRNVAERVIVIDLSRSMDAEDIKPSRLIRVRQKVEDILARSEEMENAIVVYAASPFIVSPLTNDAATIKSMLSALRVDVMPAQGSRTVLALDKALELLRGVRSTEGEILLFTDSPVDSAALTSAATIAAEGFSLSVIGVGSTDGAPIPNPRAGFLKDRNGNIVVARLDEDELKSLAAAGGGIYRRISSDESDIDRVLYGLDRGESNTVTEEDGGTQTIEAWVDRGPWLMLLLLPLTAIAFRRGWL